MIPWEYRADKVVMDVLLADPELMAIYGKENIYQGYAEPNTLARVDAYILVQRISAVPLDKTSTGEGADQLRRVRLQIDVSDTRYSDMVRRAEKIKGLLSENFPDCIDGDSYGTDGRGQKVFNVCSIDALVFESADGDPYGKRRCDSTTGEDGI